MNELEFINYVTITVVILSIALCMIGIVFIMSMSMMRRRIFRLIGEISIMRRQITELERKRK